MKSFGIGIALISAALTAGSASAQTTIGTASNGNCYPYSCGPTDGVTRYQQGYRAGAFSGPLTFDTLSYNKFTNVQFGPNLDTGTYAISFYYAATGFDSLSSNLASNLGTLIGNFGTFTRGGAAPDTLTFSGSSLTYNPALGDLLMDIGISGGSSATGGYNVFYNADYTATDTRRAYTSSFGTEAGIDGALVTTFSLAGAVPEPATWAMMICGFGMVGGTMRRRKTSMRLAAA